MKLFFTEILGCFLLVSSVATAYPPSDLINKKIDEIRSKKPVAGIAIGVVDLRGELFSNGYGVKNIETHEPVDTSSLFMIGSTTKAFTATAAGILVQEKLLDWDQKVRTLIPEFAVKDPIATEQATLRDLLLHRTGLPRHDLAWVTRTWTTEQYLHLLPNLDSSAPFRSKWQYQNLMYMVAGVMVGRAANSSWKEVVQKRILDPLGMNATRLNTKDVDMQGNIAFPHDWMGDKFIRIPIRPIDGVAPAGAIHSSVKDMEKWLILNLNKGRWGDKTIVEKDIMEQIFRPQILVQKSPLPEIPQIDYAFGWEKYEYRGEAVIEHGGGIDNYLTEIAILPDKGLGFVILTNGGTLRPQIVLLTLLDLYLEKPEIDWVARFDALSQMPPLPQKEKPKSYQPAAGTYEHPIYGTLKLRVGDSNGPCLVITLNEMTIMLITPWVTTDPNTWEYDYAGYRWKFYLNDKGEVAMLEANLEPVLPALKFVKTSRPPTWEEALPKLITVPFRVPSLQ